MHSALLETKAENKDANQHLNPTHHNKGLSLLAIHCPPITNKVFC